MCIFCIVYFLFVWLLLTHLAPLSPTNSPRKVPKTEASNWLKLICLFRWNTFHHVSGTITSSFSFCFQRTLHDQQMCYLKSVYLSFCQYFCHTYLMLFFSLDIGDILHLTPFYTLYQKWCGWICPSIFHISPYHCVIFAVWGAANKLIVW